MKKIISYSTILLFLIILTLLSAVLFKGHYYTLISVVFAVASFVFFFHSFERKDLNTRYTAVLAVMTALSVVGRFIFAPIPAFKPVTAIVILTGIYLSAEGGFLTGALTALISNMYFGHGAWTPFQMLAWGSIGLFAGLFSKQMRKYPVLILIYGGLSGVFYSLIMDVWTVLWYDSSFNISMYKAAIISAVPYTLIYSVSNIIFLLIIGKGFGRKLDRAVILIER